MRHFVSRGLVASAGLLVLCGGAFAAQTTANMNVSISVTAACTVGVTDISFGAVSAASLNQPMTSTAPMGGLVTYTCASSNTPSLATSQGQNYASGNRMKGASGGGYLPYSLTVPSLPPYSGAQQTAQITATIPAQSTLPAVDTYTDAVVLTLTY